MRLLALAGLAAFLLTGQPRVTNATIETRAVAGNLGASFAALVSSQKTPGWIAYAVASPAGENRSCCFYSNNGVSWQGCYLEGHSGNPVPPSGAKPQGTVYLEGSPESHILFRVENGKVTKLHSFSGDCQLDGGGLPFVWLTGVNPADSIALLETFLAVPEQNKEQNNRFRDSALSAIAQHRGSSETLIRIVRTTQDHRIRRSAMMWLGRSREPAALAFLEQVLAK